MSDDATAIRTAAQTYLDGLYEGDADKLASVFHSTSALTWEENGVLTPLPRDEWLEAVRMVPLRTQLRNGDQVDIITSKTGTPSPAWERFVVSAKARSHIRRFVRNQQRGEYVALGKPMLQKLFSEEGVAFSEKEIEAVASRFQAEDLEELYAHIGASLQSARDVLKSLYPSHIWRTEAGKQARKNAPSAKPAKPAKPLTLRGLIPGMAVHYARCCHPLPGDRIVGIVTTGKGVTIHTSDCDTLESFAARGPARHGADDFGGTGEEPVAATGCRRWDYRPPGS